MSGATSFGEYFLIRRLAIGGMSEVFLARRQAPDGSGHDLVIKQIRAQHARHPEFVRSFVREAEIAAGLSHPNIASIYELGQAEGVYFIAMEFIDGPTIHELVRRCRSRATFLPLPLAVWITEEVCRGLAYAHQERGPDGVPLGLVHRDLNPRNVLISQSGDVKILDFGIALTRSEVRLPEASADKTIKGTWGYMSPEQASGKPVDRQTDLYQTGLILYELLTNEPLFWRENEAASRDLMQQHRIVRPSTLRDDLPAEVDRLVVNLLAREPEHRPESAERIIGELRAFHGQGPQKAELARFVQNLGAEPVAIDATDPAPTMRRSRGITSPAEPSVSVTRTWRSLVSFLRRRNDT